jgi:hypothetical protein
MNSVVLFQMKNQPCLDSDSNFSAIPMNSVVFISNEKCSHVWTMG